MKSLLQRAVAGVACLVVAVGCSGQKGSDDAPRKAGDRSPEGTGSTVSIRLLAFKPSDLEVEAGTKVTWTQGDGGSVHTVTSGTVESDATGATTSRVDGAFDSGRLEENEKFSHTFSEPGTYPYFCTIHQATMRGEVTVR